MHKAEYHAWADMKRRCHDPRHWNYPLYGQRGIKVCPEWLLSFENFLRDVGPRPSADYSLDRVDNDRGYEPGNVRWAPKEEQASNTRNSRKITFDGRTMTLTQWARELGVSKQTLHTRLTDRGMSVEQAFTMPTPRRRPYVSVHVPIERDVVEKLKAIAKQHDLSMRQLIKLLIEDLANAA